MRFKPLDQEIAWRFPAFDDGWHGVFNPGVCHFGTSQKSTTQTSTTAPWTAQQPYLTTGFSDAQNLLDQSAPQQQNPVAPLNSTQTGALSDITNQANAGEGITDAAGNFATNLENGTYLNSNPANGYFSSLAGTNLGLSNPGASILQTLGQTNPSAAAPGNAALSALSGTNVGASNPGTSQLESLAGTNAGTTAPGASTLGTLSGVNAGTNNGGTSALQGYANGGYFSNGYSDPTAQSILSQVVPQVASAFNGANAINNPAAEYQAAQGATAALAPIEYQNYQTQEGLQQTGAQDLATNTLQGQSQQGTLANEEAQLGLTGSQLQGTEAQDVAGNTVSGAGVQNDAASNLNSGYFSGLSSQLGAGSALDSSAVSGGNLQATAAEGLSSPYQQTLSNMVQGNALASTDQALPYYDATQALNAGTVAQTQAQNEASGQAATYNYSQLSPYQQLESYMQAITGGVTGSTGSTTTPYFQNNTANTLGDITGGASLLGSLGSIGSSAGSIMSLAGPLLAML